MGTIASDDVETGWQRTRGAADEQVDTN